MKTLNKRINLKKPEKQEAFIFNARSFDFAIGPFYQYKVILYSFAQGDDDDEIETVSLYWEEVLALLSRPAIGENKAVYNFT